MPELGDVEVRQPRAGRITITRSTRSSVGWASRAVGGQGVGISSLLWLTTGDASQRRGPRVSSPVPGPLQEHPRLLVGSRRASSVEVDTGVGAGAR